MERFNKILFYLLVCPFVLACNSHEPSIVFRYVDPLVKILPEANIFMYEKAEVIAIKGENATYQFVVRSNQNIEKLKVEIGDFTDTISKQKINFDDIKVSFIGNIHVGRPQFSPPKDILLSASSFYPDPLLDNDIVDIDANVNTPIWLSIKIPKNVPIGYFVSDITICGKINGNSFKRSIPLTLKLYNISLDEQKLMVTNWYQPGFSIVDGENIPEFSERWWELMNQIADIMHRYRQNVVLISPLRLADYSFDSDGKVKDISFEKFDKMVNFFKDKGVLKRIAGGHIAGRIAEWTSDFGYFVPTTKNGTTVFELADFQNKEAKDFYNIFFSKLSNHLKKQTWDSIYMQHIADEPINENIDSYLSISKYVKKIVPEFKLVEACHTKDLDNIVDIWIPQLNYLHKDFDFYTEQQRKNKEVWYYTCVWPQGDYANRFIQQPLIKTRILHWINYKYGINGYLHWGLNFWRGENPMTETSAIQADGLVLPGGDAWVVYPYKNHLIPSIRLEAMRDGIVDYELLTLLEKKDKTKAKQLVDKIIYDFNKYDTNIQNFRSVRKQLLEALEEN